MNLSPASVTLVTYSARVYVTMYDRIIFQKLSLLSIQGRHRGKTDKTKVFPRVRGIDRAGNWHWCHWYGGFTSLKFSTAPLQFDSTCKIYFESFDYSLFLGIWQWHAKMKKMKAIYLKLAFSPVTFRKVSLSRFRELLDLSFAFKRLWKIISFKRASRQTP